MTLPTENHQPDGPLTSDKHAQSSVFFALLGLFFLGFIFGPIAIMQANKADQPGVAAIFGRTLGWYVTIIWLILAALAALFILPNLGN
ncbi:hypothetical protein [Galactobacter caseinivorans]|uniref:DUF4190 domain-containing protein n=1 Tax=Galactobacter caseinivorans TaxID=2676123 RepID=A0A496PK56_9MICC|nr:hypothetical protein [Galactobacter caseinivorans]RKW70837.1 hypothetical protein DWQ67_07030 [Galactobacter caseinivorans]